MDHKRIWNLLSAAVAALAISTASPANAQAPKKTPSTTPNYQQMLQAQIKKDQQFLQQQQLWFAALEQQQLNQQQMMLQQRYAQQSAQQQMMMQWMQNNHPTTTASNTPKAKAPASPAPRHKR